MKNTIIIKHVIFTILLLFSVISISASQADPPNLITVSKSSDYYRVIHVKAIEGSYYNKKVYLHITINGNTENKILSVERSLDNINYKVIGNINLIGTIVKLDLAYYYIDEVPVTGNVYYRLSGYSFNKELVYSKTIKIISIGEEKAFNITMADTTFCDEHVIDDGIKKP